MLQPKRQGLISASLPTLPQVPKFLALTLRPDDPVLCDLQILWQVGTGSGPGP